MVHPDTKSRSMKKKTKQGFQLETMDNLSSTMNIRKFSENYIFYYDFVNADD